MLGDFGICKQMNNSQDLAKTSVGTPFNFSPEIVQGQKYGNKSDCWGLGCILYELTTLDKPFQGDNFVLVLTSIMNIKPKKIPEMYSPEL